MASKRNQNSGLETKTLIKGLFGVSPIPIVGEIALSMFFMDILDKTDFKYIVKDKNFVPIIFAFPIYSKTKS